MTRNTEFVSLESMCFKKSIIEAILMSTLVQILCTFGSLLEIKIWALQESYKISTPESLLKKSIYIFVLCVWECACVYNSIYFSWNYFFSVLFLSGKHLDFTAFFLTSFSLALLSHLPQGHSLLRYFFLAFCL